MFKLPFTCYIICLSLVIDLLAFTVILPLMPAILDHYSMHDQSGLYKWLETQVDSIQRWIGSPLEYNKVLFGGLIGSWFSLIQFITMPFTGAMSDIYGRKPILLTSLLGISLSYTLWVMSRNAFTWFVMSRTVGGISKGNVSLSTAIITDVSSQNDRTKGMALIGIAFSVGFIVGPMLGATFSYWARTATTDKFSSASAIFSLILSLLNIVFVTLYFRESLPAEKRAASIGKGLSQAFQYISPISLFSFHPVRHIEEKDLLILRRTSWIYFLFLYLYSGLEFTLTFLTHLRFDYTNMQQGKLYLFAGLIMSLVHGGFLRRIKPGKEYQIAITGIIIIIPSFILIGLATNTIVLFIGIAFYSFSSATVVPCLTTIVSTYGPPEHKGVILGIFRSIGALARALGPITISIIFWRFGSSLCYCCCALLLILPLFLMIKLGQTLSLKPKTTKKTS